MSNELFTPSTESGREMLLSNIELDVMKLKLKLQITAHAIYDQTVKSNISDEKRAKNHELTETLLDAKKVIEQYQALDAKRYSRNIRLISEIQKRDRVIQEMELELKNLKDQMISSF